MQNKWKIFWGIVLGLSMFSTAMEHQLLSKQIKLANGLAARYLTREIANGADRFAPWPQEENPSHLVFCIESARSVLAVFPSGQIKYNPSVQSVDLSTGEVRTILRGMDVCDGIRLTAWGSILVTEKSSRGGAYELIDILKWDNFTISNADKGEIINQYGRLEKAKVIRRSDLPHIAWKGLTVLNTGVVLAIDDLSHQNGDNGREGGAIFKFVPSNPWMLKTPINDLSQSPLSEGKSYVMQVDCISSGQQMGKGCEVGNANWIEVEPKEARFRAYELVGTSYNQPEDLHRDPNFYYASNPEAIRFCWLNKENKSAKNFAEVLCAIDIDPLNKGRIKKTVSLDKFLGGEIQINSLDRLAFQPHTGILYVIENRVNGEIFACLPDGEDSDLKSDGCQSIMSVVGPSAGPTGFEFLQNGKFAALVIKNNNDKNMSLVDGYATDDVLLINGFQ